MPTIPNPQSIQPTTNPLAQPKPSQIDLLLAAASSPTLGDVAKRKPKGKGK